MIDSIIRMIKSALGREVRYGVQKGIRKGTEKLSDTVKDQVAKKKAEKAEAANKNTEDEEN